jgi:hypothetical protein
LLPLSGEIIPYSVSSQISINLIPALRVYFRWNKVRAGKEINMSIPSIEDQCIICNKIDKGDYGVFYRGLILESTITDVKRIPTGTETTIKEKLLIQGKEEYFICDRCLRKQKITLLSIVLGTAIIFLVLLEWLGLSGLKKNMWAGLLAGGSLIGFIVASIIFFPTFSKSDDNARDKIAMERKTSSLDKNFKYFTRQQYKDLESSQNNS